MKKAMSMLIVICLIGIMAVGCQTQKPENAGTKTESIDTQEQAETGESEPEEPKAATETETEEPVLVYLPNDHADGFVTEEQKVEEITPEALIGLLIKNEVLSEGVAALGCEVTSFEGEDALDLDLNVEFRTMIQSLGSAGEYMTLGSVCNTFLDAYDCKKIHITVEGGILETGHNDYPGYLGRFE